MRQLITRIDDQLYEEIKARAAAEGRSMNALVSQVLEDAVSASDERRVVFERLRAAGRLVFPTVEGTPLSRDEVIASTRGAGTAVSEALEADRSAR